VFCCLSTYLMLPYFGATHPIEDKQDTTKPVKPGRPRPRTMTLSTPKRWPRVDAKLVQEVAEAEISRAFREVRWSGESAFRWRLWKLRDNDMNSHRMVRVHRERSHGRIVALNDLIVVEAMRKASVFVSPVGIVATVHRRAVECRRRVQLWHRARLRRIRKLGEQHQTQHQPGEERERVSKKASHGH
jgi:hypothetical protein